MKKYLLLFIFLTGMLMSYAQSGRVNAETNTYIFNGSLADQYMFYGYASPDSRSKKLIMFSVYPGNIGDNPIYRYPLGAYHETGGLKDGDRIEYVADKNGYAQMKYIDAENKATTFYIRRRYVKN